MKRKVSKILFLLIIPLLLSAADQGENKPEKPPEKKITIAVYPPKIISEDKADSALGPVLASFLINELNKSAVFKVIEQEMSAEVEKQLDFANSDKCDQTQCKVPIGNAIPAQKILVGTVARLGEKYVMNVRLIDIEKQVVEFSAQEQVVGKKEDLDQLTQLVAIDLREKFGEKVPRPQPTGQNPQGTAANSNSAAEKAARDKALEERKAAEELKKQIEGRNNILGLQVMERHSFGGNNVIVESLAPDSPCSDIIKPGEIIFIINPFGPTIDNNRPAFILKKSDFDLLVSRIKPGTTVGIRHCQSSNKCSDSAIKIPSE